MNKTLKTFVSKRLKRPAKLITGSAKVIQTKAILNEYVTENGYKFNYNFPMRILICVPTLVQVKVWKNIVSKAISNIEIPCIIDIETKNSLEGTCREYHLGICDRISQTISRKNIAVSRFVTCENIIAF